jgi:hypothetical protein
MFCIRLSFIRGRAVRVWLSSMGQGSAYVYTGPARVQVCQAGLAVRATCVYIILKRRQRAREYHPNTWTRFPPA